MRKIFRNFEKVLLVIALLGFATTALGKDATTKKRASQIFPKGSNAILNMNGDEFEKSMTKEDQLMFIYVFDTEQ